MLDAWLGDSVYICASSRRACGIVTGTVILAEAAYCSGASRLLMLGMRRAYGDVVTNTTSTQ
jgi:hypothetical protein